MKTKRRIVIAMRQDEVFVFRRPLESTQNWCPACSAEVTMVTPEQAALVRYLTPRIIYRLIEAGDVHFLESQEGAVLVCLSSLLPSEET